MPINRTRLIIENALDAIVSMDSNGLVVDWNSQASVIFGWSSQEIIGKSLVEFIIPHRFRKDHKAGLARYLATRKGKILKQHLELSALRNDGDEFPVELTITPTYQTSETVIFTAFIRDITERVQSSERLKRQSLEARLLHQTTQMAAETGSFEESLKKCMDLVCEMTGWPVGHVYLPDQDNTFILKPTGIWYLQDEKRHKEFRLVTENTSFEYGIGLPGRIQKSNNAEWISNVQDDPNFPRNRLCKSLGLKGAFGFPITVSNEIVAVLEFFAEDEMFPDESLLLTVDSVGKQVGSVLERKRSAENLRLAKEDAEAASRTKSEFLANMSHEIRTPMNAILGFTEILSGQLENQQQKEYLAAIQSSGRSLLGLINDILDLSKVESGKMELENTAISPQSIFEEMKQIFSQKTLEKGIDFEVDVDLGLPKAIILDETRLRQVLFNLVGNAIKFTDSGYVKLAVTCRFLEESQSSVDLIFSVEDSGIGIPEDQCESVFNAFEQQQGQSNAKYGGTGLGLAITKRLVNAMGGDISATSSVGKGSIFHVTLPKVLVATSADIEVSECLSIDFDAITFSHASILITDDIEVNRNLVRGYLDKYDFTLYEAANGAEAVEYTKLYRPNLILMDMKMPVMDGRKATELIKNDDDLSNVPIVALTASVMKHMENEMKELCDGYLRKPVSKTDLVTELCKFLSHTISEATSEVDDTHKTVVAESTDARSISMDERKKLAALVTVLKDKNSTWEEISYTLSIDELEDFGTEIANLGREYEWMPLVKWGENLTAQALSFDMDEITKTLTAYPEIIQGILSKTE